MNTGRWVRLARQRSKDVGTCWMWQGAKDALGYAKVRDGKGTNRLHHLLCKEVHQPPKGRTWVARHLCGCKACVNPAHIVPGTQRQNHRDDRAHARLRVQLPDLEAVRKLAAAQPPADLPALTDAEHRQAQRRERLTMDQTTRGGDGIAEQWFREMAAYVGSLTREAGMTRGATDDDVLLLALIARKRRELAGQPEPRRTGLSTTRADIAGQVRTPTTPPASHGG